MNLLEYECPEEILVSELTPPELDRLDKGSRGIHLIDDFLSKFKSLYGSISPSLIGYALGLDKFTDASGNNPYYQVIELLGIRGWKQGYQDHGLEWMGSPRNTRQGLIHRYLEIITITDQPITFFVPPTLKSHPNSGHTRWEIEWCLNSTNSDKLSNMFFVFGLYKDIGQLLIT